MISPNLSGDFAVYTSGFQPEADDIMNPAWFLNAVDIAVDINRNSYIVDQQNSDITVFNFNGSFFKKAGYVPLKYAFRLLFEEGYRALCLDFR